MKRWRIEKRKVAFDISLKLQIDIYEVYKIYYSEGYEFRYILRNWEYGKEMI
jgi:hypothetical protein